MTKKLLFVIFIVGLIFFQLPRPAEAAIVTVLTNLPATNDGNEALDVTVSFSTPATDSYAVKAVDVRLKADAFSSGETCSVLLLSNVNVTLVSLGTQNVDNEGAVQTYTYTLVTAYTLAQSTVYKLRFVCSTDANIYGASPSVTPGGLFTPQGSTLSFYPNFELRADHTPIFNTPTNTPSDTPVPPTATPVSPTDTSIPPTDTPIPATDTPTATAPPPTDTPTFAITEATHTPIFTFTPSQTLIPSLTTCAISVTAPSLISPLHRAHTTDTTPSFTWGSVTGAQSYRLMVYLEDRSFEYKKRVFVPNYTLKATEAMTPAKYLWRVRTQDNTCSTWTGWSTRNTLFVD